jgi:hypothetical protein
MKPPDSVFCARLHNKMKTLTVIFLMLTQTLFAYYDYTPYVKPAVFSLSMIMMHDVVNPPAASRYYAYCMMGAYCILEKTDNNVAPIKKIVKNIDDIAITNGGNYNAQLAALYCILETGRLMLPSGEDLKNDEERLIETIIKKHKVKKEVADASVAVANSIAKQIIAFAKKDNYSKLSAKLRYTPKKGDGFWYPTPPMYMEAVEPNWYTVTPLVLDSAQQCKIAPPTEYSADTLSNFYQLAMEVYNTGNTLTPEQLQVASFWDCNPFVVATSGHMSLGFKKISPGGHWMNITCIAAKNAQLNFSQTIQLLAIEGITQMDAFISCWAEKYSNNRIRPETYINKHIDIKWQPILQTPPFPEYTSGHSVVSGASAEVLTYLIGNIPYTDDSETMFEIPARKFTSFRQASAEAAISRLYGGIHFKDAIENGSVQGKAVGNCIINRLKEAGIKQFGHSTGVPEK